MYAVYYFSIIFRKQMKLHWRKLLKFKVKSKTFTYTYKVKLKL